MKRLFIGVPIGSEKALQTVCSWQFHPKYSELNKNRLAWTKASNWHMTIVFLGACPDEVILLEEYSDTPFETVLIDRVTLFESVSTSHGVRYDPLYEKMLLPLK